MSRNPKKNSPGKQPAEPQHTEDLQALLTALAEREARLQQAQRIAHLGHWDLDLVKDTLYWSDEVYRIFGLEPQEFGATYEAFLEHVYPDDRDFVNQAYTDSLKNRTGYDIEHRVLRKDGSVRIVNERCDTEYDDDGNPLRSIGTVLDITDQRRISEQLAQANDYNRNLIEVSLDPLVTISPDGKITDVNRATEGVTGVGREELIGTDFCDYFTEPEKARQGYEKVLADGFVRDYPLVIRHASGRLTNVLYHATVYKNVEGKIEGVFAAARDITESKEAAEAIGRLSRQIELILNSAGEGIYGTDTIGKITFINPAGASMLGYRVAELQGKSSHAVFHHTKSDGSPYPEEECPLHKSLAWGEASENSEEVFWTKAGKPIDVEYANSPMVENGKIIGAVIVFRDVTERKLAHENLKRAGAYNRSLIEASLDPLVTIDSKGKITDVNAATENVTGYYRADLIGTDFCEYFTDPEKARAGYQQVFREGEVHDYLLEIRRTDGHLTPVLYNASLFRDEAGEAVGVFAAARDITSRMQGEAALRRSNRALHVLSDCNQVLVRAKDEAQLLRQACRILVDIGGYPMAWIWYADQSNQLSRHPVAYAGLGADFIKQAEKDWSGLLMGEGPLGTAMRESRTVVCSDIEENDMCLPWREVALKHGFNSSMTSPLVVDGQALGALQVFSEALDAFAADEVALLGELSNDIAYGIMSLRTGEKHDLAEKALRESEARYHNLFEESKETIFVSSPDGKILDLNPAGMDLFGLASKAEMTDLNIARDIFADEADRAEFQKEIATHGFIKEKEIKMPKRDGEQMTVLMSVSTIRDEKGEISFVSGVLHDMTEHRRMEEQLYRAQRLESVGRLAGGIAHDFNNFLTAVKGYIDLANSELPAGAESSAEDLQEATSSVDRAAGLIRQLLIFSRRESVSLNPMDLNTVIMELYKMLSTLIGERYRIELRLDESLPRMNADTGHIEQVIMNLVVNARDAMEGGGTIVISTDSIQIDEQHAHAPSVKTGQFIRLQVEDTGCGMDEETIAHIFEPFFTRKQGREGTGLGLSLVYGITEQHGGWIEVESTPGAGSTFTIFFPAMAKGNDRFEEDQVADKPLAGRGERVLVVEDEEPVRKLVTRILTSNGYEVVEAGTAEAAMELFNRDDTAFSLICSDVVLPGEDGLWLASQVCSQRPEIPIILASGYNQPEEEKAIKERGYRFIPKPYSQRELLAAIQEMLQKH